MSFNAPKSMAEQIAQHLANQIISGDRVANERIQELKIVDELDVSRGSVREALLLMERRHLVEIVPRRGAMVAEINAESVENLFDVFGVLVTRLAILVAQRWKDGELDELVQHLVKLQSMASQEDREEFMSQVFVLLNMAYPLARNEYLHELLVNMQPAVHRCYALAQRYKPNDGQAALVFFSALMTGVVQREVDLLPVAVKKYFDHQLVLVLAALEA
ncbi:MAG: GntR family transcriptional regulator [Oleispira sp.]|mgnify:FL=1|nr:GntR family transcriptional regulator [Oleispira sp.]|tara:strand:+ start:1594 stop:2247 length:654 start_codon:yes stop_codon:yes gene_type:complete